MAKAKDSIRFTQDELKELLDYDPTTGTVRYRERDIKWFGSERIKNTFNTSYAGEVAGCNRQAKDGYIRRILKLKGKSHLESRVIWKWMAGESPEAIDHINHDPTDNRWCNLRESCPKRNTVNKSKYKNNKSGVCGVYWRSDNKKWRAGVRHEGKMILLGHFEYKDLDLAAMAVMEKRAELGFDPSHGMEFSPNYDIKE